MKTNIVVVLCVIMALCGCGKEKTFQNTPFSGKDYTLVFPNEWKIKDKEIMGANLIGLSPLEDPSDTFCENINVVLENVPKSMIDKEYLEASLKNMGKTFGFQAETEFEKIKVGNTDGYHLRYSLKMGQNEMDNDVYIVITNGAAYILTCSNAKGKRETFKATMDSIIATFKIN